MYVHRTLNILSNCLLFVLLQVCFVITYEYGIFGYLLKLQCKKKWVSNKLLGFPLVGFCGHLRESLHKCLPWKLTIGGILIIVKLNFLHWVLGLSKFSNFVHCTGTLYTYVPIF